jgi:hypothetical protein
MNMTPIEVYQKYLAIKLHFTTESYDYFLYKGKVNSKRNRFDNRNDRGVFEYVARKYQDPEIINRFVSNFLDRESPWIGEIFSGQGKEIYTNWLKRNESMSYFFSEELTKVLDETGTLTDSLVVDNQGKYPLLLKMYLKKDISPETIVMLNNILNFLPMWKQNILDEYYWPGVYLKLKKYTPFVEQNLSSSRREICSIILNKLHNANVNKKNTKNKE